MSLKLKQRLLSGALAVLMAASVIQLPQPVHAAGTKPKDDSLTVFDELGFDTSAPEGYQQDESITDTPYGREVVTMNVVDELAILKNRGTVSYYGMDYHTTPLQHADKAYFADQSRREDVMTEDEVYYDSEPNGKSYLRDAIMLEGNFSEDNNGRRANSIMVGISPNMDDETQAKIFVTAVGRTAVPGNYGQMNVRSDDARIIFGTTDYLGENAYMPISAPGESLESYDCYNYLKAAVGDFDADGIDEIAWYLPSKTDPCIQIWDLQDAGWAAPDDTAPYMKDQNWKLAQSFRLEKNLDQPLNMVSLASGDFNRDGIDDLAVSWGYLGSEIVNANSRAAVLWGATLSDKEGTSMLSRYTEIPMKDSQGNTILRAGFTVGDSDGDGHDELIMGGSRADKGAFSRYLTGYKWNGKEFVRFMEKTMDLQQTDSDGKNVCDLEMGRDGKANWSRRYGSMITAPANVAVGRFFGPGEAPAIYIDGMMVANTSDGLKLVDVLTFPQVNPAGPVEGNSYQRDPLYSYVEYGARAATLGTDGTDTLVTVSQFATDLNGDDLEKSPYGRSTTMDEALRNLPQRYLRYNQDEQSARRCERGLQVRGYAYNDGAPDGKLAGSEVIFEETTGVSLGDHLCFALPDRDHDTSYMKYTGTHFYRYADPEVIAVLASPPYFKDLTQIDGELDDSSMVESSTKYASSKGTGSGDTTTTGFSVGTYMGFEHEIKAFGITLATTEMEAEMNNHFTWETEDLREVNYQITYENTIGQDGVVLCAMPIETYVYKTYTPDGSGNYQETEVTVNIPYEPSVRVVELSQYQQVYDDYKEILPNIDSHVLSHQLGDPSSYPSSLSQLPRSQQVLSYPGDPSEIGQGGKSSITQTIEMTQEHSNSFNYEFELNFKVGGGIGGAKAGVTGGFNVGTGSVQVSTSGSTYEATMTALPSIAADYGYSFNWRLVGFLYGDKNSAKQYPVVTYLVTSERVPPHLPENFTVNEEQTTSDSVQLEWDYTGAAAGFVVYRYFESTAGSDYYEIATVGFNEGVPNSDGSQHFTFVDRGLAPDTNFSYRIQTIGNAMPNLSVPSGSLHTFTKPLNTPTVKVTENSLMAYPDIEVSTTAYVENGGSGSYEYNWQKWIDGEWKDLSSVSRPKLSGLRTPTMKISFADAQEAGEYRCQVVSRSGNSKILKSYSPVVTVDFDRRTAVADGGLVVNSDNSISLRLKGEDTTSLPSGSVTLSLVRDGGESSYTLALDAKGEAVFSDADLTPGVYSVSAYYGGNRVFKPLSIEPDPVLLYVSGITGSGSYLDVKDSYTYGEPLNITKYTVDASGKVQSEEAMDTIPLQALEIEVISPDSDEPLYVPMATSVNMPYGQKHPERFAQGMAGGVGRFRLTVDGAQRVFSVEPMHVKIQGLKPYYMVTEDRLNPSKDAFLNDVKAELRMEPAGAFEDADRLPGDWLDILTDKNGDVVTGAVKPGHYTIKLTPFLSEVISEDMRNYVVETQYADLVVTGAAYKLSVSVYNNDFTRGSVRTVNPKDGSYATAGQTVLMEAKANPGFEVDYWTLNGKKIENSDGKVNLTIVQGSTDSKVQVRFRYSQNRLTLYTLPENPSVGGESVENKILTSDELFFNGSPCAAGYTINLTPQAAEGWSFDKWEYLETGKPVKYVDTPTLQVTMPNTSVIVRAIFTRDSYALTLGENLTAFDEQGELLKDLSAVTGDTKVTVKAAAGFQKAAAEDAWIMDGTATDQTGDSFTFQMLKDTSVTVPVSAGQFSVSVNLEGVQNGTATVTPSGMLDGGTGVTFEAAPNRDFAFVEWDLGNGQRIAENPYTTTVETNMTAKPVFGPREGKTVNVPANVDWNISGLYEMPEYGTAPRIYPGETLTLTAFPKKGEVVSGWTVNNVYKPKAGATLTIAYEDAVDGMSAVPSFNPGIMVPVTVTNPKITMTLDGEPLESGEYVGINSEIVFTYHKDPFEYVGSWTVNGEKVKGATKETATILADKPITVDVVPLTDEEVIKFSVNVYDGKGNNEGIPYNWTIEFGDALEQLSEKEWRIRAGSSVLFSAELKPEYRDTYYENEEAFNRNGYLQKDGKWYYYVEQWTADMSYLDTSGALYYHYSMNTDDFASPIMTLEVPPVQNGSVSVSDNTFANCDSDRPMVIEAVPDAGYQLQKIDLVVWSGDEMTESHPRIYLNADGKYETKIVSGMEPDVRKAKLIVSFCEDTPQPAQQIILSSQRPTVDVSRPEESVRITYQLLPANSSAELSWRAGDKAHDIIVTPDGQISADKDYYGFTDWNDLSRYYLDAKNPDGSVISATDQVNVTGLYDYYYLVQTAAGQHVDICGERSNSYHVKERQNSGRLIHFSLVLDEGYEIDTFKLYETATGNEITPTRVPADQLDKDYIGDLQYTFRVPESSVLILATAKPVDGEPLDKVHPIVCREIEHLTNFWPRCQGIAGQEITIDLNEYIERPGYYREDWMPDLGYEVDVANTTIVGNVSGQRIEIRSEAENELTFTMPDEPITVTPAVKAWENDPRFTVEAVNSTVNGGSSATVFDGVDVEFEAGPTPEGMVFRGWKRDGSVDLRNYSNSKKITGTVHGNAVVQPIFLPGFPDAKISEKQSHLVTVNGGTGSGVYTVGSEVQIQVQVPEGKLFKRWYAEGVELPNPKEPALSFEMPDNKVYLNAAFVDAPENVYTLTVVDGTGSGNYTAGSRVTVRAVPPAGMVFKNWNAEGITLSDSQKNNNTLVLSMPANHVVLTPVFEKASYDVQVLGGSGDGSYHPGENVTVTADAVPGHKFHHWTVEGVQITDPTSSTVTFKMPANPVSLTANFDGVYHLEVVGGTGSGQYTADENVTIQASVPAGQVFDKWVGEGVTFADASSAVTTLRMPAENVTVTAVFAEHKHQAIPVAGQAPTCTEAGWKDYYTCECGRFFEDEACTKEITDLEAWKTGDGKLDQVEHQLGEWQHDGINHWRECTVCHTIVQNEVHTFSEWTVVTPATETEDGLEKRTCPICGREETRVIPSLDHVHKGILVAGQAPTCTEAGWKDYYTCACGRFFEDEACTKEITDLAAWQVGEGKLDPVPHTGGEWQHDGEKHWRVCICGKVMEEGPHTYGEWTVTKAPTANETGIREHTCSVCGYKEIEEIPAVPAEYPILVQFAKSSWFGKWTTTMTVDPDGSVQAPSANSLFQSGNGWMSENGKLYVQSSGTVSYADLVAALDGNVQEGSMVRFVVVSESDLPMDPADPQMKTVSVQFVDENGEVGQPVSVEVAADCSVLTAEQVVPHLPKGYELAAADQEYPIVDGTVQVPVTEQAQVEPVGAPITVTFRLAGWNNRLEGGLSRTMKVTLNPGERIEAPFAAGYIFGGRKTVRWNCLNGMQADSGEAITYEMLAQMLGSVPTKKTSVTFTGIVVRR